MDTTNLPIVGPDWDGYSYSYGNQQVARVHFDIRAAEELPHAEYPVCVRVILFMPRERVQADGQPASAQEVELLFAQQRRLIDQLTAQLVRCRLAGSMIYGGMFDLIFQVKSDEVKRFTSYAAEWAQMASPYRIEVKTSKGWDFFDAKVRPTAEYAQQISDRKVIQGLINAGSDPKQPHQLEHKIIGAPKTLHQIARDLETNGFTQARYLAENALLINRESPLELIEVWNLTARLVGYCAKFGARYDGWGAAVVKRTD